jgi:hypothetical protein
MLQLRPGMWTTLSLADTEAAKSAFANWQIAGAKRDSRVQRNSGQLEHGLSTRDRNDRTRHVAPGL